MPKVVLNERLYIVGNTAVAVLVGKKIKCAVLGLVRLVQQPVGGPSADLYQLSGDGRIPNYTSAGWS